MDYAFTKISAFGTTHDMSTTEAGEARIACQVHSTAPKFKQDAHVVFAKRIDNGGIMTGDHILISATRALHKGSIPCRLNEILYYNIKTRRSLLLSRSSRKIVERRNFTVVSSIAMFLVCDYARPKSNT